MISKEVFEAISHPIRIQILKKLAEKPRSFSELKRELGIKSSGKLDFHLKKLKELIALDEEGRYCLTKTGYAALQAIDVVQKYGWQKRAYILNLAVYALINIFAVLKIPSPWLWIVFFLSTAWLAFYTYWNIKKRKT